MTDHGVRGWHLLQRLVWMQTNYPWSVLWILFMVGVAMIATGLLVPAVVVGILIAIVAAHSLYLGREAKTKGKD